MFTGTFTDPQGRTFAVSGDSGAGDIGWKTPEGTSSVGGEFAIDNSGSYRGSYSVMAGNPVMTSGSIRKTRTGS
ncbi:hypothetical protein [Deinococcus aestuarii]|uniref:hypothetical protein n=1 Tax=Deinococcus aestuarii TaxID=2774531 RepID=UPI001C0E154D|nr:hypothetical protein [Deinococcus aestuarii]